jgi:hypothetical protein
MVLMPVVPKIMYRQPARLVSELKTEKEREEKGEPRPIEPFNRSSALSAFMESYTNGR